MAQFNLGNVVGLIRAQTAPSKTYVLWGKILNPSFPDIVEINYYDGVSSAWVPVTDPTHQYWLRPVLDDTQTAPPANPSEGDRYLVAAAATGAWSGKDDQVATWKNSAWVFTVPQDGYIVSVRTKANTLFDYRGTYGDGGEWVENEFQVPIAPGTYVPTTEKGQPLGIPTLDIDAKIPASQVRGSTLPFTPANSASWAPGTATVWEALEHLLLISGSITPSLGSVLAVGNNADGDKGITNLLFAQVKVGGTTNQASAGGCILTNVSESGNEGEAETPLVTIALAANTLGANKQTISGYMLGTILGSEDQKRIAILFGSVTILNTGLMDFPENTKWRVDFEIVRVGEGQQVCNAKLTVSSASMHFTLLGLEDAEEDETGAIDIILNAEGVEDNDIILKVTKVFWNPAE